MKKWLERIFGKTDSSQKELWKFRHLSQDVRNVRDKLKKEGFKLDVRHPIIDDKRTNPNYRIMLKKKVVGQLEYDSGNKKWEIVVYDSIWNQRMLDFGNKHEIYVWLWN